MNVDVAATTSGGQRDVAAVDDDAESNVGSTVDASTTTTTKTTTTTTITTTTSTTETTSTTTATVAVSGDAAIEARRANVVCEAILSFFVCLLYFFLCFFLNGNCLFVVVSGG